MVSIRAKEKVFVLRITAAVKVYKGSSIVVGVLEEASVFKQKHLWTGHDPFVVKILFSIPEHKTLSTPSPVTVCLHKGTLLGSNASMLI